MKVTLSGPELAGEYLVVERRTDGSVVLRPDGRPELLSEVIEQTRGQVFRDEELLTHLDRIAATEDDLPSQNRE